MDFFSEDLEKNMHGAEKIQISIDKEFIATENARISMRKNLKIPSERLKREWNELTFMNSLKELEIQRLVREIESYKKDSTQRENELAGIFEETMEKVEILQKKNEEYNFLKEREGKNKCEWKAKMEKMKKTYEIFEKDYLKALFSKDTAINCYMVGKQKLISYQKQKSKEKESFYKKLEVQRRVKVNYLEENMKMIENIGAISYRVAAQRSKIARVLSEASEKIKSHQNFNQTTTETSEKVKNFKKSLENASIFLKSKGISITFTSSSIITSLISLHQQVEIESNTLSHRFYELSSIILKLKKECGMYKTEFQSLTSSELSKFLSKTEEKCAILNKNQGTKEENVILRIYSRLSNYINDIISKFRIINTFAPNNSKYSVLPDLEDLQRHHTRIKAKRNTLKIIGKSKTIARMSSFVKDFPIVNTDFSRKSLPDCMSPDNIAGLCEKYFEDSEEKAKFLMNNQIITLFFQHNETLQLFAGQYQDKIEMVSRIYEISHKNVQSFVKMIVKKLLQAISTADEDIPKEAFHLTPKFSHSFYSKTLKTSPRFKVSFDSFGLGSEKAISKKETIKRRLQKSTFEPISVLNSDLDVQKEARMIRNRLRNIQTNEKKACVSLREFKTTAKFTYRFL